MDKILRLPDVMARVGLAKTQIYGQINAGHFPGPVPLTVDGRCVGWRESDISRWIEKRSQDAAKVLSDRRAQRQREEKRVA